MPDDRRPAANHPQPIRIPDQLQQSKRGDEPRPAPEPEEIPADGVLGQLAAEPGHD